MQYSFDCRPGPLDRCWRLRDRTKVRFIRNRDGQWMVKAADIGGGTALTQLQQANFPVDVPLSSTLTPIVQSVAAILDCSTRLQRGTTHPLVTTYCIGDTGYIVMRGNIGQHNGAWTIARNMGRPHTPVWWSHVSAELSSQSRWHTRREAIAWLETLLSTIQKGHR